MGRRYRGRHRAPSSAGLTATRLAAGGVVLAEITLGQPAVAHAEPGAWEPLIRCESGGNPKATNPDSTASGLYQFLDGSWRYYGGAKYGDRAKDATPEQQHEIALAAFRRDGLRPWDASRHCWGDEGDRMEAAIKASLAAPPPAPPPQGNPPPAPPAPGGPPAGVQLGARDANGNGWYQCSPADLRFDWCDGDNIGQVVPYPAYAGRPQAAQPPPKPAAAAPVVNAAVSAPLAGALSARVVSATRTWIGVRYAWGGNGRSGVDCSGLVKQVLLSQGYRGSIPRTAHTQWKWTKRISRAEARPGDLFFMIRNGRAHHVGIVVGPGRMIDAPQPGARVGERPIPTAGRVEFGRLP